MATLQHALPNCSQEVAPFTADESADVFEHVVQRYLKMSTSDFLSRMESGYFAEHPELELRLDAVLFYLPLIRR